MDMAGMVTKHWLPMIKKVSCSKTSSPGSTSFLKYVIIIFMECSIDSSLSHRKYMESFVM